MTAQLQNLDIAIEAGTPDELGAIFRGDGTSFALFSGAAERVELCLFDHTGEHEIGRVDLGEYTDEVWHGFVPGIRPGQRYGYRVHGRFAPEEGLRFNPSKLLLDPYAREFAGELRWNAALYGYRPDAREKRDLTQSAVDSAPFMPKCVVSDFAADRARPDFVRIPWEKTIFYETHVRGTTMLHPAIPDAKRGTFDGLADEAIVDYVRRLGITSVELLPVHAFVDDHRLAEKGLRNHWGYNSIGFFAPQQRYIGAAGLESFRAMVRRFHDAGIEVILDVVYNHTGEGNELGPTLSFRGIDNGAYYRLMPDSRRHYVNDTGTGNTLNISHPRALRLVLDSLRYWVEVMEVDGFRFDLGTILGRGPEGFDAQGSFFAAVAQDPVLRKVKLVAEPWDIGPGGYQVGGFPPGWAEWNDKFRDTVRSYWKGEEGLTRKLAARVTGSGDVYDFRGRRPWSSVNFITAHDGFTLHDLVSYNDKHNKANGEDNRDGHGDNRSFNHGVEGPTEDAGIRAVRERQKRNLMTTLLLSHGTPMILAGDEFGRTQDGNNNAYCQDNDLGWMRWNSITEEGERLRDFVSGLLRLRRKNEIFTRASFRDGCRIRWFNAAGGEQTREHWDDDGATTIGLLLSREGPIRGARQALLLFNAFDGMVDFALPPHPERQKWRVVVDTDGTGISRDTSREVLDHYALPPRSMVVLM